MPQPSPVISISSSSPTPSPTSSPSPSHPTRRRLFQSHARSPISISSSSSASASVSTSPSFISPTIPSQSLTNPTRRNLFFSHSSTPSPSTSTTPSSSTERLRQRFLDAAHRRAWLSAPGAYNFSQTAYKAYINNNLPSSPSSSHNSNKSPQQTIPSQDVFIITDTPSPNPTPPKTISTPSETNLISAQIDSLATTLGRQVRINSHLHSSTTSLNNTSSSNNTTTSSQQLQTLTRAPSLSKVSLPRTHRTLHTTPVPDTNVWLPDGEFRQVREEAAQRLLRYYDQNALGGVLGTENEKVNENNVTVGWSKRLYKTAGVTYLRTCRKSGQRTAEIILSEKVVDEVDRLYRTLAHEMCHAAMWIVDEVVKPPHGKLFRKWVTVFERFDNGLEITTTHDYSIKFRFYYECTKCEQRYGRHSRSIDTKKKVCGVCAGSLVLLQ